MEDDYIIDIGLKSAGSNYGLIKTVVLLYEINYKLLLKTDDQKYMQVCEDFEEKFFELGGELSTLKLIIEKCNLETLKEYHENKEA